MAQISRKQEHQQKLDYWKPIIEDWRSSKVTTREYCHSHHLPPAQFKYWQYQLAPDTKKPSRRFKTKSLSFIQAKVTQQTSHKKQIDTHLEFITPQGYCFKFSTSDAVSTAIALLAKLPC